MLKQATISGIIFLSLLLNLSAQIVNTEKLRFIEKENGWMGDVELNFGLNRNKAGQTLRFGGAGRFEYLLDRSRWMILGGYYLTQFTNVDEPGSVPKNFSNWGFSHLRYNRTLGKQFTWEAFIQGQFDEIQEIDGRFLSGSGFRFQIHQTDSSSLFLGMLLMYEYEETSDDPIDMTKITFNRDLRLSTYLSTAFKLKDYFTFNHVTYFQPNLAAIDDFRISSETRVSIKLRKNLSFDTYFQLVYDTRPAMTVPRTMFSLTNGLRLSI